MISWSIDAAKRSGVFERVIVSTDDDEIAAVAREAGAEVPFVRPPELSDDYAGTTDVVAHATRWAVEQGLDVGAVCCIYATAPLLDPADIRRALELLETASWQYVFSATHYDAPIFRSIRLAEDGGVEMFYPEHFSTRSQDLPAALHDAAQFYWGRPSAWLQGARIFARHSTVTVIPKWRAEDIDTPDDLRRAELLFSGLRAETSER